jgi:hypothetical protein
MPETKDKVKLGLGMVILLVILAALAYAGVQMTAVKPNENRWA